MFILGCSSMNTLAQSNQNRLSRVALSLLRYLVKVLPALAAMATGFGILLGASTYEPHIGRYMLSIYPRYRLAQEGLAILQDRRYPLQSQDANDKSGKEILAGVIDIDDASWPVILEFVQSEIAIRKSERNEPVRALPGLLTPEASTQEASPSESEPPPIDFARIKSIAAVEVATTKVGSKPLVPPYRLIVRWPHSSLTPRYLYEFLSFQEFGLDLRQMLIVRLRYYAMLASGIAFAITMALHGLRWGLGRFAPGVLIAVSSRSDAGGPATSQCLIRGGAAIPDSRPDDTQPGTG
jgi:hypothetical protein